MKNVAVFFGGQSVEHDISVITGTMTVNSLDKEAFNGVPIYVDHDGKWYTGEILKDVSFYKRFAADKLTRVCFLSDDTLFAVKRNRLKPLFKISVAINCMHGERGEDGSLSGLLSMCGVPLASPDTAASALCMDKAMTKTFVKSLNIPTVKGVCVSGLTDGAAKKLSFPVIVKPCKLGSSIGVSTAKTPEELRRAVAFSNRFGERTVIEEKLANITEINCAAYLNENGEIVVSECEKVATVGKFLSFEDKYKSGKRQFPADIDDKFSRKIKRYTKKVYAALSCRGVIRIDYFISGGKVYLNEVNTVPGSLAFYLFSEDLKGFSKMLTVLIRRAEEDYARSCSVIRKFSSSVLDLKGVKGAKRL